MKIWVSRCMCTWMRPFWANLETAFRSTRLQISDCLSRSICMRRSWIACLPLSLGIFDNAAMVSRGELCCCLSSSDERSLTLGEPLQVIGQVFFGEEPVDESAWLSMSGDDSLDGSWLLFPWSSPPPLDVVVNLLMISTTLILSLSLADSDAVISISSASISISRFFSSDAQHSVLLIPELVLLLLLLLLVMLELMVLWLKLWERFIILASHIWTSDEALPIPGELQAERTRHKRSCSFSGRASIFLNPFGVIVALWWAWFWPLIETVALLLLLLQAWRSLTNSLMFFWIANPLLPFSLNLSRWLWSCKMHPNEGEAISIWDDAMSIKKQKKVSNWWEMMRLTNKDNNVKHPHCRHFRLGSRMLDYLCW